MSCLQCSTVLLKVNYVCVYQCCPSRVATTCTEHCGKGPFVDVYESIHDSGTVIQCKLLLMRDCVPVGDPHHLYLEYFQS